MYNLDRKETNLFLANEGKEFIIETLKDIPSERLGIGQGKGHFGEYLQGYFDDINGDIIDRACVAVPLVSHIDQRNQLAGDGEYYKIPYAASGSIAVFFPIENEEIAVEPNDKFLSKQAAQTTLKMLDKPNWGGLLKIITRGKTSMGLGTSTSDIVATIRAVSESFGAKLDNDVIAKTTVGIESASDGIMYDHATLFVTTQGNILEKYRINYPEIEILGFNSNHHERGLNTLDIPPRKYNDEEKKHLWELRKNINGALNNKDINQLGQISSASAKINQRFVEKPYLEEIVKLATDNSAPGVVIAHSGTMVGIIFDPRKMPKPDKLSRIFEGLESIGYTNLKRYISK